MTTFSTFLSYTKQFLHLYLSKMYIYIFRSALKMLLEALTSTKIRWFILDTNVYFSSNTSLEPVRCKMLNRFNDNINYTVLITILIPNETDLT